MEEINDLIENISSNDNNAENKEDNKNNKNNKINQNEYTNKLNLEYIFSKLEEKIENK